MAKRSRSKTAKKKRVKKRRFNQAQAIGAVAPMKIIPEQKQVDTLGNLNILSGSAAFSTLDLLNGVAAGALTSNRIGRKIIMKKLTVRWIMDSQTPLISTPFRILVFYDKSPNQVAPVITDVLNSSNFNGNVNLNNTDRFIILKDFYPNAEFGQGYAMIMPSAVNGSNGHAGKFTIKFPRGGLQAQYALVNATISDISTGAIFICWCMTGRQTTGAGNPYTLTYNARVRFTDV